MRAAFFSDGKFEIREVPVPVAQAGDVLIAVHACGICGSDVHFYSGGAPAPSVCPGHEIAGHVALSSPASVCPSARPWSSSRFAAAARVHVASGASRTSVAVFRS
jgi:hypothetical protein